MFRRFLSRIFKNNRTRIAVLSVVAIMFGIYLLAVYNIQIEKNTPKEAKVNTIYNPRKTVVAGDNVSKEEFEKDETVIEDFVNYCNNKQYEKAYNLLTDECKEIMYPDLEEFVRVYCSKLFEIKKDYSLKSWINNGNYKTYLIKYADDSLSTGKYENTSTYDDYITIVDENGVKRINTNGYVGRFYTNKEKQIDQLDIVVENADIYLTSIVYNLKVKNKTKKIIQLDGLTNSEIQIGLKTDEIVRRADKLSLNYLDLSVNPLETKIIKIKFNNNYSSGSFGSKIYLNNIILNREEYMKNKEEYKNIVQIEIDL